MSVRRTAMTVAALGFFALAAIGSISGVPPLTCGLRALAGAGALFVLATVAGRAVVDAVVDAIVNARTKANPKRRN